MRCCVHCGFTFSNSHTDTKLVAPTVLVRKSARSRLVMNDCGDDALSDLGNGQRREVSHAVEPRYKSKESLDPSRALC